MAYLVKVKIIGIIFFSALLGVNYLLFDTGSNENLRYKEWHPDSTLHVSDFMMSDPIFGHENVGAIINTQVGIRESQNGKLYAYAYIDRFHSWYKDKYHDEKMLNHETYHANISSVIAKILNKRIQDENLSFEQLKKEKEKITNLLNLKQAEYDRATDHGLNHPQQHYWEYKIDSMLNHGIELSTTDKFSGATAYFPAQPEIFIQKDSFSLLKVFQLKKYGMKFQLLTGYDHYVDTANYEKNIVRIQNSLKFQEISSYKTKHGDMPMVETHYTDTSSRRRFHDRFIYDNTHEYRLTVSHPASTENDTVYKKLVNRFFNSFALKDMTNFWKKEFLKNSPKKVFDVTVNDNKNGDFGTFYSLPFSDYSIRYHKPFKLKDKIIIPFKSEKHHFKEIEEILMIINNDKIYSQNVDSINQFIHIKLWALDKPENKIQFGYLVRPDSTEEKYQLHGSIIHKYKIPQ